MYYPSSHRLKDAHIFEIAPGQRIQGVDVVVRRLPTRRIPIRVTQPGGQPAQNACVHVAHRYADEDEADRRELDYLVDPDRTVVVDVYDSLRVSIWAEDLLERQTGRHPTRYSAGYEFDADRPPPNLNLVVDSGKHPYRGR